MLAGETQVRSSLHAPHRGERRARLRAVHAATLELVDVTRTCADELAMFCLGEAAGEVSAVGAICSVHESEHGGSPSWGARFRSGDWGQVH